ncbi:MAG: hypothetical protein CFE39_09745 [Comamonadaceae bacterium PBBC2]|nr:MAG: hypothetical protein CFE39_09745 [Comamonadaceae bacterium PBBC2]
MLAGNETLYENGEFVLVISKSNPADFSFNLDLNYYDTQQNGYILGGGDFPVGSTTLCKITTTTLPTSVTLNRLSQEIDKPGPIGFQIDWTTVAKGEYTYSLQCELKVGLAMVSKTLTQKIRLID